MVTEREGEWETAQKPTHDLLVIVYVGVGSAKRIRTLLSVIS